MIAARLPTETEMKAHERRRAFRASIDARAAELKASKLRAAVANHGKPVERAALSPQAAAAIAPEAVPAKPRPPKSKQWFQILDVLGPRFTIGQIKVAVAREFRVRVADLTGPRRQPEIVLPRQIAMWLCRDLMPEKSFPSIGWHFGGRDHTTVLHACRAAPAKVERSPDLIARVAKIRLELDAAG